DITDFKLSLPSLQVVSSTSASGYFSVSTDPLYLVGTNVIPPLDIIGRADFPLPEQTIYRNVMLCGDEASESNDDLLLCYETKIRDAQQKAEIEYVALVEEAKVQKKKEFINYLQTSIEDKLEMRSPQASYIVTLYGYDRAGNLAYTVPPRGVQPIWGNTATES